MSLLRLILLNVAVAGAFFFVEKRDDALGTLTKIAERLNVPEERHWLFLAFLLTVSLVIVPGIQSPVIGPLDFVISANFAWAALSLLWAEDRTLTAWKTCNWLMVGASAFTIAARLSFTHCVILVAACSGVFVLAGLVEEIATRSFRPGPYYRFSGSVNAIKQSQYCVLLGFSTVYLVETDYMDRVVGITLTLAAVALLWLTRTRNSFWTATIAAVLWFLWESGAWTIALLLLLGLCVLGVMCLVNSRWREGLWRVLLLGRYSPDWPTLSGRTRIWRYALRSVPISPILGFGFAGFWQPRRSNEKARMMGRGKPVPSCLSLYLETLINTGVVGLGLFGLLLVAAYASAFDSAGPQSGFMLAVLIYVTAHSVFETSFVQSNFRAFAFLLLLFGLS